MKLSSYGLVVALLLRGCLTLGARTNSAIGDEQWDLKIHTLPPKPNPNPNNMTALGLTINNFTVACPNGLLSSLVYDEEAFKLFFNATVFGAYAPINITIPRAVENPWANIGIYVDGFVPFLIDGIWYPCGHGNGYILSEKDNTWVLSFELEEGNHTVLLNLDPYQFPVVPQDPSVPMPEFSSIILPVLMLTLFFVIILRFKGGVKSHKSHI